MVTLVAVKLVYLVVIVYIKVDAMIIQAGN